MGDWHISIQGTGAHHNKDYPNDADKMVDRFIDELMAAGHSIKSATITYGGRQVYNLGAKQVALELNRPQPVIDEKAQERRDKWLSDIGKQKTFLE